MEGAISDPALNKNLFSIQQYHRVQKNSQKYLGPPVWYRGDEPGNGTEIFLSNLQPTVSEADIFRVVSEYGPIYMIRLPVTFTAAKGFAYIRYFNKTNALAAISGLRGRTLWGKPLNAELSRDCRTLRIDNWPEDLDESQSLIIIQTALSGDAITQVKLFENHASGKGNMGFILVTFTSHNAAAVGRREIKNDALREFTGRVHQAKWTRGDHEIPEDKYVQITELYVGSIPQATSHDELERAIRPYLKKNSLFFLKFKYDGFAFLHFNTHEEAEEALLRLKESDFNVRGQPLSVSWAKGEFLKKSVNSEERLERADSPRPAVYHGMQAGSLALGKVSPQKVRMIQPSASSIPHSQPTSLDEHILRSTCTHGQCSVPSSIALKPTAQDLISMRSASSLSMPSATSLVIGRPTSQDVRMMRNTQSPSFQAHSLLSSQYEQVIRPTGYHHSLQLQPSVASGQQPYDVHVVREKQSTSSLSLNQSFFSDSPAINYVPSGSAAYNQPSSQDLTFIRPFSYQSMASGSSSSTTYDAASSQGLRITRPISYQNVQTVPSTSREIPSFDDPQTTRPIGYQNVQTVPSTLLDIPSFQDSQTPSDSQDSGFQSQPKSTYSSLFPPDFGPWL